MKLMLSGRYKKLLSLIIKYYRLSYDSVTSGVDRDFSTAYC